MANWLVVARVWRETEDGCPTFPLALTFMTTGIGDVFRGDGLLCALIGLIATHINTVVKFMEIYTKLEEKDGT